MNKFVYTDKLYDILEAIDDKISTKLISMEDDSSLDNEIGIDVVDRSNQDWSFDINVNNKWTKMKVSAFIKYFLGNMFNSEEIKSFTEKYNNIKNERKKNYNVGGDLMDKPSKNKFDTYTKVEDVKYEWDPTNVRNTFLSLVCETYPHGHEDEVYELVKNIGLNKDKFGNYYKIVGSSDTMFTSHFDTADRTKSKVVLYTEKVGNDTHIITDGNSILGADDKAGVAIMLYMISHNVSGVYYFFAGEERGGIGSSNLSSIFETVDHLKGIKKCVSFDRRNYHSIITSQFGMECCSDEFATELASQYNSVGMSFKLDPTGIYTDSASFMEQIPECTNISVGYFDEHTTSESQNITFLEKLAQASVKIKWSELKTHRKVGIDDEILRKYGKFIDDFKLTPFDMDFKIVTEYGRTFIKVEVDESDVDVIKSDILTMSKLFSKHNMDPDVFFYDEYIKIELSKESKFIKHLERFSSFNESEIKSIDDEMGVNEVEELCYWIRKMFIANNIKHSVSKKRDSYDIESFVILDKKVKMSTLLHVFDVIDKIRKELSTYNVDFELFENKKGFPIMLFTFYFEDDFEDGYDEDEEYDNKSDENPYF